MASFRVAARKAECAGAASAASHVQPAAADVAKPRRNLRFWIDMTTVEWILGKFRSLGPYMAVALFLPGGSIIALVLWAYRHRFSAR